MEIKKLSKNELEIALEMVWKVFCEYEADNYPEVGKKAFFKNKILDNQPRNG